MSRRKIALLVVVALAAAAVVTAVVWPTNPIVLSPPGTDNEAQMRAAVVRYVELQESVRPAKLYGRDLTPRLCISYMKGRDDELKEVAADEALYRAKSDWMTLDCLIRAERDLSHDFGAGTIPVSCSGEIGYWRMRSGGGDTYTVRAAVLETWSYARWDAKTRTLVDPGKMTYDEASAEEYTLQKTDGVWKVIACRHWMSFTRGHGVHPDSA